MTDNRPITKHTDCVMMDFYSLSSDFTLKLKTRHLQYNSGGDVINSCSISGGDNDATTNQDNQRYAFFKSIIVMGFAQE